MVRKSIAAGGLAVTLILATAALAQPPSRFEAVFQARCAGCHDPAEERAPSRADIAKMAPSQIHAALEGVMAPMAAGLSKEDLLGLSAYLASAPQAATASPAPTAAAPAGPRAPVAPAKTFEWRTFGGDYASTRYAPLDQINKDTVKNLRVAWRQSLTPAEVRAGGAPAPPINNQTTPIMVGGLVYFSTGVGGVAALDAASGKVVWHVDRALGGATGPADNGRVDGEGAPYGAATRSLTHYADGADGRIIALIGGRYLTALNAKTGKRIETFGQKGQVDLREGQLPGQNSFTWRTGPTVIVKGVVIIGSVVSDINSARMVSSKTTPRGDVRGIDARTGKQLWLWHSIPLKGEFGSDTWLNGSAEYTGAANVWAAMSGDEALGQVYLPVTTPTNDWYGGLRPGANLFAESIVALDARTGKRKWHFQGVHHGLWDYDFPCAPVLVDITVKGRKIKALAQPSKQAYLYVLDRRTGKPVWPIVEAPVEAGDVPGEWYSPTQPMPLNAAGKPLAYDQQGVSVNDLIDFTPQLRAEAEKILSQYRTGPMFSPPIIAGQGKGAGYIASIHMAGSYGGTNWPGAGYDPETGILYVPSSHTPVAANMVRPPAGSTTEWVRERYIIPRGPEGLPLFKPPYGRLVAIDLNNGAQIKWTAANGSAFNDHPRLKGLNLPPLGKPSRVGPLVTKSLVFMGEGLTQDPPGSGGKGFRAFDKQTGQVLWETTLDGEATGVPMTYAWQGKQYLIVPIGGAGHPGEFVALTVE